MFVGQWVRIRDNTSTRFLGVAGHIGTIASYPEGKFASVNTAIAGLVWVRKRFLTALRLSDDLLNKF